MTDITPPEGELAVTMLVKKYPMMQIIDSLDHLGYSYAMLSAFGGEHRKKFKPVTISAWNMPISEFLKQASLQEPELRLTLEQHTIWIEEADPH